jgi:uncharacterized damage-inducible protein DinB
MTPEQGQLLCKVYLETNQYEAETTKKVIRAVPDDKKAYTPDPKSMTAHQLAWHIASSEVFILDVILLDGKMPEGRPPDAPPTIAAILDWYETNRRDRLEKLKSVSAERLAADVPFFAGGQIPNVGYLNLMNMHTAHHRGQLSTYLRPMGSKVPSIYGGSADEPMKM